jgi:hypothetical protein
MLWQQPTIILQSLLGMVLGHCTSMLALMLLSVCLPLHAVFCPFHPSVSPLFLLSIPGRKIAVNRRTAPGGGL